jgi:hypothetical protein
MQSDSTRSAVGQSLFYGALATVQLFILHPHIAVRDVDGYAHIILKTAVHPVILPYSQLLVTAPWRSRLSKISELPSRASASGNENQLLRTSPIW